MGGNILSTGSSAARQLSERIGAAASSVSALTAIEPQDRSDGMAVLVTSIPAVFVFDEDATEGGEAPDEGDGRWIPLGGELSSSGTRRVRGVIISNVADLEALDVDNAYCDGLTYVEGERVLLQGQTAGAENGIYLVGAVAAGVAPLTRAPDYDTAAELNAGDPIYVQEGTRFAGDVFRLATTGAITLDTTALTFTKDPKLKLVSKQVDFEDLTDADGSQSFAFAAALPVGAVVQGGFLNVTVGFTDGAAGVFTADLGINGGDLDAFIDGADLASIAKVDGPAGVRTTGLWGAITPALTILGTVNVDTATAGDVTAYLAYIDHLL
jgi:hypothetical protein